LNLHGLPPGPKPDASANSATPAHSCLIKPCYHNRKTLFYQAFSYSEPSHGSVKDRAGEKIPLPDVCSCPMSPDKPGLAGLTSHKKAAMRNDCFFITYSGEYKQYGRYLFPPALAIFMAVFLALQSRKRPWLVVSAMKKNRKAPTPIS